METITTRDMTDRELLDETVQLVSNERSITADLLTLLAEVDARRLYLGEGCSSLFTWCTQVLRLSEHAAYHRIEAARATRRFPAILSLVRAGSITLTTVAMLRPHLTDANHEALLAAARHKSKREVEHQIACLAPKPDAASLIRREPAPRPHPSGIGASHSLLDSAGSNVVPAVGDTAAPVATPAPRPEVRALSSDRYLLRVTLSADAYADMEHARSLMLPRADPAAVIEKALALLVAHLERQKFAKAVQPRASERPTAAGSRHLPAALRRAVWARDVGQCAFVGQSGRCRERSSLEFHHVVPFARGGPATIANIELRCRAHNRYESEREFGEWRELGPDRVGHDRHSMPM